MVLMKHKPAIPGAVVLISWAKFGIGPKYEEVYTLIIFMACLAIAGLISSAIWPAIKYQFKAYPILWLFGFLIWYLRFIDAYDYPPTHYILFGLAIAIAAGLGAVMFVISLLAGLVRDRIRKG